MTATELRDPIAAQPGFHYVGRKAAWYEPHGYSAAYDAYTPENIELYAEYKLGRIWDVYRSDEPLVPGGDRHIHYTISVNEWGGSADTLDGRYTIVLSEGPLGFTATLMDGHETVEHKRFKLPQQAAEQAWIWRDKRHAA